MRWEQGRATVEKLLADKDLQRVPPSREHADRLLAQAAQHIGTARAASGDDPEGAYALMYDAARKALTAILENQGLRPTSRGGHIAVYQSVLAQLDPPMGRTVEPFDRMRRRRKDAEYPDWDAPELVEDDVAEDLPKVAAILSMAQRVMDTMSPF